MAFDQDAWPVALPPDFQGKMDELQDKLRDMKFDFNYDSDVFAKEALKAAAMADKYAAIGDKYAKSFNFNMDTKFAFAPQRGPMQIRGGNDENVYNAGLRALEGHRYDEALEDFNAVTARAGTHAEGAWYWKAYTLNKLGKRDEARASIAELKKANASSRWLDDAKALDLEIQQAAGRPVSPDTQQDDDLKVLAIQGLMQSDPDRAIPLLEGIIKGSHSPKVKDRALYVLAQNQAPRAQQTIDQVARGSSGNPDLQLKAINYISSARRRQDRGNNSTPAILPEIYNASNDVAVKRAILNAYNSNRDFVHLSEVAKNEKSPELRQAALRALGENNGQPELWQIYQGETNADVKAQILECMYNNGNVEKLSEVVRTEKDPKVLGSAIQVLASQRAPVTGDTLVAAYGNSSDERVKARIVDSLYSQRNAKALVDIARAEKDSKLKLKVVDRLSNMKQKEATDYLMEILK